jgi:predicted RNA-binding Zn-ribbon protein involved in translation (DUF1610 family)
MSISFVCPCGKKLKVDEEYAGRKGKCPACGQSLIVPAAGSGRQPGPGHSPPPPAAVSSPPPRAEAESSKAGFPVKPGYHKGGKGRFTRLASPCDFEFAAGRSPILNAKHCSPGNIWIALLATFITWIVVQVMAQVTGFMVGPGLLIWILIINAIRTEAVAFDLGQARQVILDSRKKEIGILGPMHDKETWVGVKCRANYEDIAQRLKAHNGLPVEEGTLKTTQMSTIIVLVVVLVLAASAWFAYFTMSK